MTLASKVLGSALVAIGAVGTVHCGSSVEEMGAGGGGGASSSNTATTSGAGGEAPDGGGDGGPACADPASPEVFELGTGEKCFERIAPGQVLPMMAGPQGGFHLWTAIGCGDCGGEVPVEIGVKDPATATWYAGTAPQKLVIPLDPSGWHQLAGLTSFLPGTTWDPATQLVKGTHVILAASVLDANGAVVHFAEVEVEIGDIEYWNPPCDPDPATCGLPGGSPCCTG